MKNLDFKQTKKVGVAGSFINQMMGNNSSIPEAGKGATILHYSDRVAYSVKWVSDCKTKCIIQSAEMKYIGSGYGDERYEYTGNDIGHDINLEWSNRSKCWGIVSNVIEFDNKFLKFVENKYGNKYDSINIELKSRNINHFDENTHRLKLIEGITITKKAFSKVSIIFGIREQYRDPSF